MTWPYFAPHEEVEAVQALALLSACPACNAAPGQRCANVNGIPSWAVHRGRAEIASGPFLPGRCNALGLMPDAEAVPPSEPNPIIPRPAQEPRS